eukprot:6481077-Amphidinium_carterae.1
MDATRFVELAFHALIQRVVFGSVVSTSVDPVPSLTSLVRDLADKVTECEQKTRAPDSWWNLCIVFLFGTLCGSIITIFVSRKWRSRTEPRAQVPFTPSSRRSLE